MLASRSVVGRLVLVCAAVFGGSAVKGAAAQAVRPTTMQLFPSETVLWVRTADAGLLVERYQQSSLGQMYRDPDLADLMEKTGATISDAYSTYAQEFLEADLADLLKLPQGEIAFGVVHRPGSGPGFLLIADFEDQVPTAQRVVERIQELAEQGNSTVTAEQLRSDEATVIRDGNDQNQAVAIVRRDTAFVVCNDSNLLQSVLDHWDGIPVEHPPVAEGEKEPDGDEPPLYSRPLADNTSFSATLNEIAPGSDEPPQAVFYVDPVGMVEAIGGTQTGVRIAMATFPALGIDGIKALGGAMWVATDKWDSLVRGHLLLANPRAGVVKVARLETGVTSPPNFVPSAVENYMACRVDAPRLFNDIADLYDRFQYEGAFRKIVDQNLTRRLGIDFEQEFVGNLSGSACYLTGYDETAQTFGGKPVLALGVDDAEAARGTLAKLAEKFSSVWSTETFGATEYYSLLGPRLRELPPAQRPFSPACAVLDDHLVLSQDEQLLKQFIEAHEGSRPRLNDSLQYRLIRSRLERMTRGEPFSAFGYHDVEPLLRHVYEHVNSDESRQRLQALSQDEEPDNAFLRSISGLVNDVEWPPVEALLRYSAPSGSVMIDTPTGWHMISFGFKPTAE